MHNTMPLIGLILWMLTMVANVFILIGLTDSLSSLLNKTDLPVWSKRLIGIPILAFVCIGSAAIHAFYVLSLYMHYFVAQ